MASILQLDSVCVAIDGSQILRGVSLALATGELVTLMGRNGVGKTTTLRTITGLLPATSGTVTLDGNNLAGLGIDARGRAGIGYVPQGREIFSHLTVLENLHVGLLARGWSPAQHRDRIDWVCEMFPVLPTMFKRKGGVLSGGQQQQLAIARALLTEPKVLLLDEPTEGIQPSIIQEIGETLKKLRRSEKLGILLVEQYVDFAREVADRFYVMDRGNVVASGDISELKDDVVHRHIAV